MSRNPQPERRSAQQDSCLRKLPAAGRAQPSRIPEARFGFRRTTEGPDVSVTDTDSATRRAREPGERSAMRTRRDAR